MAQAPAPAGDPLYFSGQREAGVLSTLEKFRSLLESSEEALLLTSRPSRHYVSHVDIAEGMALIGRDFCDYFTDARYLEAANRDLSGYTVELVDENVRYADRINAVCQQKNIRTLGVEDEALTAAEFTRYQRLLHPALVPLGDTLRRFRSSKEDWELERIEKAQEITDRAFSEVLTRIRVGMNEKELCAELIYCLYKNGGEGLAFDPIVVSGPNTSMPHGVPGDRKLQNGDFITMDFGTVYRGYCSDMTRTVALGYATEEMKQVYDTVLMAQLAGIAASKTGISGHSIDAAARTVIENAGYGEFFTHSYGHSLGLEVHEAPYCAGGQYAPMPYHAVASAEPGIYIPGKFGVRIEDSVVFELENARPLPQSPKNLLVISGKSAD